MGANAPKPPRYSGQSPLPLRRPWRRTALRAAKKGGIAAFLFARKLLSQFPSPMGATPPIPRRYSGQSPLPLRRPWRRTALRAAKKGGIAAFLFLTSKQGSLSIILGGD